MTHIKHMTMNQTKRGEFVNWNEHENQAKGWKKKIKDIECGRMETHRALNWIDFDRWSSFSHHFPSIRCQWGSARRIYSVRIFSNFFLIYISCSNHSTFNSEHWTHVVCQSARLHSSLTSVVRYITKLLLILTVVITHKRQIWWWDDKKVSKNFQKISHVIKL